MSLLPVTSKEDIHSSRRTKHNTNDRDARTNNENEQASDIEKTGQPHNTAIPEAHHT